MSEREVPTRHWLMCLWILLGYTVGREPLFHLSTNWIQTCNIHNSRQASDRRTDQQRSANDVSSPTQTNMRINGFHSAADRKNSVSEEEEDIYNEEVPRPDEEEALLSDSLSRSGRPSDWTGQDTLRRDWRELHELPTISTHRFLSTETWNFLHQVSSTECLLTEKESFSFEWSGEKQLVSSR